MLAFLLLALATSVAPAATPAPDRIELKHFRPADSQVASRFTCVGGGATAEAVHGRQWQDERGYVNRVVRLRAARELTAAELDRVNALVGDQAIQGISASCQDDDVQFWVLTYSAAKDGHDAVLVTVSADGKVDVR